MQDRRAQGGAQGEIGDSTAAMLAEFGGDAGGEAGEGSRRTQNIII